MSIPFRNDRRTRFISAVGATIASLSLTLVILFTRDGLNSRSLPTWTRVALAADKAADDASLLKEAQDVLKALSQEQTAAPTGLKAEQVQLGRKLFFETRVSADGTLSCHRCHLASLYGADGIPTSHAIRDLVVPRNAPTILNSGLQFRIHWRGELASVEEQAQGALLSPAFGNPDYPTAMGRLKAIPGYHKEFQRAFPDDSDPINEKNWGKAIGAYERSLVTPCRLDEFLGGKINALSVDERKGLRVFLSVGCADCHYGVGLGGEQYSKFGVKEDYWKATQSRAIDKGRFDITNKSDDEYVFKVPPLRNVEMTAPYFHDGSVNQLADAVRVMAKVQLGKSLSDQDVTQICQFLGSLTGKLPANFAESPVLPPAGFKP